MLLIGAAEEEVAAESTTGVEVEAGSRPGRGWGQIHRRE